MDKNSPSKWNFRTYEWLGENSPNPSCHTWNHKSVFLHCITLQFHERKLFCTFLPETLYDFYKRSPSKCKISENFDCSGEISPNLYFNRLLLLKVIKFQLKKYRGVMFYDNEDWCRIWRKTDLLFQKWQEFGEFWSEHSKVSKIYTFIRPFCGKYITFDLKSAGELSLITLKSHVKFEEKLACGLENDMRNLANFHQSIWNSQKFAL